MARHHTQAVRALSARRELLKLLRTEAKQLQRLQERIHQEVEDTRRGPEIRRHAEALLANAGRIPRGASEVTVEDPSSPGSKLRIELDPARSFSENANALFQRAGRLERARQQREGKAANLVALLANVDEWRAAAEPPAAPAFDSMASMEALLRTIQAVWRKKSPRLDVGLSRRVGRFLRDIGHIMERLHQPHEHRGYESRTAQGHDAGAGSKTGSSSRTGSGSVARLRGMATSAGGLGGIHPRRFELAGGWIILVGRSNQENDRLTHKVARQRDLWFHARGVAGSHVVLQRGGRKDNPSKETLEAAASIAAYYSKARTSGLVPVIYTEKRYVRKPRKAPPGLAVCLREKVLMVEPKLPTGATRGKDIG